MPSVFHQPTFTMFGIPTTSSLPSSWKKTYFAHPQAKDGKPIKHLGIRIQNMGNGGLADATVVLGWLLLLYWSDMFSRADCDVCANGVCGVWEEYPGVGSTRKN